MVSSPVVLTVGVVAFIMVRMQQRRHEETQLLTPIPLTPFCKQVTKYTRPFYNKSNPTHYRNLGKKMNKEKKVKLTFWYLSF